MSVQIRGTWGGGGGGGGRREKKENKKIEVTVVVGKVPIEQKMGVN